MIKKILTIILLFSTLLNAGNFSFSSQKNNDTSPSQCSNVEKITKVKALGEGRTKEIAISNTHMFALADYIGTKYDIEFQQKNREFIKKNILDNHKDYTRGYTLNRSSEKEGITQPLWTESP